MLQRLHDNLLNIFTAHVIPLVCRTTSNQTIFMWVWNVHNYIISDCHNCMSKVPAPSQSQAIARWIGVIQPDSLLQVLHVPWREPVKQAIHNIRPKCRTFSPAVRMCSMIPLSLVMCGHKNTSKNVYCSGNNSCGQCTIPSRSDSCRNRLKSQMVIQINSEVLWILVWPNQTGWTTRYGHAKLIATKSEIHDSSKNKEVCM